MKVNCLSCGHKLDLDDAYDDFQGEVKCFVCTALLEIKTEEGKLKSVRFIKMVPSPGAWGERAAI